ncbi:hypothetical protein GCM10011405_27450 [Rufibacter glacialis]|nr:hypothetical protein GCM10011405_27450 [Rufibacter glacialis]
MTVVVASLPYVVQKIKLPFDASFGVYIYGFVIQQCLHAVFPEMGVHSHQVISSLLAIGFGVFSWQFVEKRFIKLGNEIRVTDFINFINKKSKVQIENIPQTQQIFFNDRVLGIDIKKLKSSKFIFLISFTLVAAVIHALVLKFVFPGYYSPLYPLHSDYYIPAAVANSSLDVYSFSGLLTWPRPVHITFMKIIGYTGIQGSIACVIALVCINTALGALLLKYIFKIPITKLFLLFFILYCFLLFSQPYFYIFYAQDIGSQLSYFFLLIGALVYFFKYEDSITFANISLFVFCFLAFLSKETYGLVGLSSAFLWFIYYRRKHAFNAFIPMIATGSALVIAFAINILVKSSFINPDAEVNSDYHISLNPMLVIPEWLRYANESINIVNIIVAILILFLVIKSKNSNRIKLLYLLAGCIIATGLSWVPNAILPNHHFKGYSFNGAYLFYLPLLILPVVLFEKDKAKGFSIAVVVLCLLSPVFNKNKYSDLDNTWVLIQEGTQRNLLKSLDKQIGRLEASSTPQKIIIQGISFPFHPFSHPEALRVFSNAKFAHFDVVNTNPSFQNGVRTDLVKFISPSDTLKTRYDERWQFDDQGNLIAAIDLEAEKVFLKPKVRESAFIVTSESLPLHKTEGFYNLEGNLRWTNGEASIGLDSTISVKDSVILKLDTFMPPICKNVSPELKIVGSNNKIYKPRMFMRSGDTFYFLFLMNNSDSIKKIDITSERIDASPDLRILSFPFVRLEVIKK